MGKMNEVTLTTILNDNEYVSVVLADGTLGRIKKAEFAEAIRSVMSVATEDKNGLMSQSQVSSNGAFSTGMLPYSDDIDNLHKILKDGLTTIACTAASKNRPYDDYGGIIINVSRATEVFSLKAVFQMYISATQSYKPKMRFATGNNDRFTFSNWE